MSVTALVTGRLLADPEQRTGPSGKPYTLARMAVQTDGDESAAVSLIAFGTAAEQLAALSKGDTVAATGRCKVTTWSGRDGEAKAGLSFTVDLLLSAYHLKRKRAAMQWPESAELASTVRVVSGRFRLITCYRSAAYRLKYSGEVQGSGGRMFKQFFAAGVASMSAARIAAAGCLVVCLCFAPETRADEPLPASVAVFMYTMRASHSLNMCGMSFKMQQMNIWADNNSVQVPESERSDYGDCTSKARTDELNDFKATAKSLKSTEAKKAQIDVHAAFAAALAGITPGDDERKITYAARQQSLLDRFNEACARLEVSLP